MSSLWQSKWFVCYSRVNKAGYRVHTCQAVPETKEDGEKLLAARVKHTGDNKEKDGERQTKHYLVEKSILGALFSALPPNVVWDYHRGIVPPDEDDPARAYEGAGDD